MSVQYRLGERTSQLALTVAMALALARLAVDAEQVHDFVADFLAKWGEEAPVRQHTLSRGLPIRG